VPIDGVGFQMHVLPDWPSVANIEASFRTVAQCGLKVKITELDVCVNNKYNSSVPVYTSLTAAAAAAQNERHRQLSPLTYAQYLPHSAVVLLCGGCGMGKAGLHRIRIGHYCLIIISRPNLRCMVLLML